MHRRYPQAKFYIYTGDKDAAPDQILELAEKRFNVGLEGDPLKDYVEFVYLHRRVWVEAWKYPVFTLLGQSLGSVYLGEANSLLLPTESHVQIKILNSFLTGRNLYIICNERFCLASLQTVECREKNA